MVKIHIHEKAAAPGSVPQGCGLFLRPKTDSRTGEEVGSLFSNLIDCSGYSALYALPMVQELEAEYFAWLRR